MINAVMLARLPRKKRVAPPSLASAPQGSEEARRFLQERVALFGLIMFLLATLFFVAEAILLDIASGASLHDVIHEPGRLFHLLACALLAATWLIGARGKRSWRTLQVVDAIGTFGASLSFALMVVPWPGSGRKELVIALAVTNTLVARAVLLPSTARRTLAIGVASWGPALLVTFDHYPLDLQGTGRLLDMVLWGAVAVVIATVASRVIYGLRERVREARQLGQYFLEEKLGEGGMGAVYRARHAMLRRPTAIKLLPPEKAGEESLLRFEREVQLTSELTHPNTIAIYDYGRTPDGVFYYAMEYLAGFDLDELVRSTGPQPPARVAHILAQVCGALSEAHAIGLIHRDIKPANIILCERGGAPDVAKVVDFGLVKSVERGSDKAVSQVNTIAGTPLYMSPEAISALHDMDGRSDLYALGAVGYYLLTGTPVFNANTVVEVLGHHLHTRPERPSARLGAPVPPALEELLLRCLEKDRSARPASANAMREALAACEGLGAWSIDDARAWWAKHGDRLKAREKRAVGPASGGELSDTWLAPDRSVAIDLESRAAVARERALADARHP